MKQMDTRGLWKCRWECSRVARRCALSGFVGGKAVLRFWFAIRNKKLLETGATLVVTGALLVVTRS